MRVTIAKRGDRLSAYVAKKDIEERIVAAERDPLWGGWVELENGWRLQMPDLSPDTRLPTTVEAKRLSGD